MKLSVRNLLLIVILFAVLAVLLTYVLVKTKDFGLVLLKVGRGLPARVPSRPEPLRSVTVVPNPGYEVLKLGSRFRANPEVTIPSVSPTADTDCANGVMTSDATSRKNEARSHDALRQTFFALIYISLMTTDEVCY